jgi:hypothetical protein
MSIQVSLKAAESATAMDSQGLPLRARVMASRGDQPRGGVSFSGLLQPRFCRAPGRLPQLAAGAAALWTGASVSVVTQP